MIEILPICADEGKSKHFQLFEDGKRILELHVNRLMTADDLREVLKPKQTKGNDE